MKDLMNKEHYYYKIHALLMKSMCLTPFFYRQPPYMDYPLSPYFYKKILHDPPSMIFQKSQPPVKMRVVHTMEREVHSLKES